MGRKFLTTPTLPTLPSPPSSPSIGDMYFDTTLGKIGVYTNSGWVYNLYQIEDGSITTSKIADGAVTPPKLAPGAAIANIGYTPANKDGDTINGYLEVEEYLTVFGSITGFQFISTVPDGISPFLVNSTQKVDNLNADLLDGYNTSISSTAFTVAVRDFNGNLNAFSFVSTAPTGTAPLQVSSTTKVTNLNADLLDGYDTSTSATANTVAVRDSSGNISANRFISTVSTGTAPLQVSSTTKVDNLNADLLDGYRASVAVEGGTIPVRDSGGFIRANVFISTISNFFPPLYVNSSILVNNLNADLVDNYHASTSATTNTIAVRDSSGYLNASGLIGSNTQDLLINAKNYGIELRIDEGNTGTRTFRITKTSSGATTLLSVDSNGNTSISGTLSVSGTITGTLNGNASTATKLQTARTISLGGSLSGSTSFDGSANVTINASINAGAVGTNQLADNAVTTPKIADESVTYAKLAQDVRDAIASSGGGGGGGGTRIFQTTIGNGTSSTYTVTHNFGTTNVEVSLTLLSTNEKIGAKVEVLNNNQIRVSFISPIASNSVKVVVIG